MTIKYTCHSDDGNKTSTWEAVMTPIKLTPPYEATISARGSSFHLVVGTHQYGNFICIPNWNIGTELASLGDRFWNHERLAGYTSLSETDACSIAYALVELNKIL